MNLTFSTPIWQMLQDEQMVVLHMHYGRFSNSAFVLYPRACGSFRGRGLEDSSPCSPMVLLDESLIGFQSRMFGGLVSLVQVPRIGMPDVRHRSPPQS